MEKVILASASPRRREILHRLGVRFDVVPAKDEPPADLSQGSETAVQAIARHKAAQVASMFPERLVIGADTLVEINGVPLGKPTGEADAADMLRRLSGRMHRVHTGVWVIGDGRGEGFCESADVFFRPVSEREIEWYISTGEPMDKAGAYGIQGCGMRFIREIRGDFYTVMGLPGCRLWEFLNKS